MRKSLVGNVEAYPAKDAKSEVIGYVQGMSDLCAPVYVVMGGEEEMVFWCFARIMDRMVRHTAIHLWCSSNFASYMIEAELPS